MRVLVTGSAGFIGFHVARALLARGGEVLGLDVVNDYYDVRPQGGAARDPRRSSRCWRARWGARP